MTTVAVCLNKENINGLAPYLCDIIGKITDLQEKPMSWRVVTENGKTRSELFFDKSDYRTARELFTAFNEIA
jgi:hypothetical protein